MLTSSFWHIGIQPRILQVSHGMRQVLCILSAPWWVIGGDIDAGMQHWPVTITWRLHVLLHSSCAIGILQGSTSRCSFHIWHYESGVKCEMNMEMYLWFYGASQCYFEFSSLRAYFTRLGGYFCIVWRSMVGCCSDHEVGSMYGARHFPYYYHILHYFCTNKYESSPGNLWPCISTQIRHLFLYFYWPQAYCWLSEHVNLLILKSVSVYAAV